MRSIWSSDDAASEDRGGGNCEGEVREVGVEGRFGVESKGVLEWEEPSGDGRTGNMVDNCSADRTGRGLDGERCTGSGNNDPCAFGFLRRGNLKRFVAVDVVSDSGAGGTGDL